MVKAIIKFFKSLYDREIDYEIEIEFSVYDVILGVIILSGVLWIIYK